MASFLTLCLQGAVDRGAGEYSPAVTSVIFWGSSPFCTGLSPAGMLMDLSPPLMPLSSGLVFFRMPLTCTAVLGSRSSVGLDCEPERRTSLGLRLTERAWCRSERPDGRFREGSRTGPFCTYRKRKTDRRDGRTVRCTQILTARMKEMSWYEHTSIARPRSILFRY